MKTIRLLILILLCPLAFHAQKSLTGLWTGTLTNEDSTIRKDLSFEIALTQYKQKVYGYSRRTFIVNDTLYYVLKRVKGKVDGDVCEVVDDEYISYNFPGKVDKGVKTTYTFRMNEHDSTWTLDGEWTTNKVKKNFYAINGKVAMMEEKNLDNSKIFPHLEELKMANDVAFYKEIKNPPPPVVQKKDPVVVKAKPVEKKNEPIVKKKQEEVAIKKDDIKKKDEPIAQNKPVTKPAEPEIVAKNNPTESKKEPVTEIVKEKPKENPEAITKKETPVVITESKPKQQETVAPVVSKPETKLPVAAAFVEQRKTVPPQILNFVSDSLELSLYDNGEVDGDTVSVLLNGEIFMAKQGLKASATKKTIYIPPGTDEITLVLYAENLGKYPPNTGLLIVHDGENVYQVRFSADLQQNASVIFRRAKKRE